MVRQHTHEPLQNKCAPASSGSTVSASVISLRRSAAANALALDAKVASGVLNFSAMFAYLRDTYRGITKPNRVTWFMWALAPLTASFIAYGSGADPWITAPVFSSGFWPLVVFLVSFKDKNSYWQLSRFDLLCGALSLVAFLVWLSTESVAVAIILTILSDFLASVPTLKKLWSYPESETKITYFITFLSFVITIPAIQKWDVLGAAFQIYLVLMNFALMFAAYQKDVFQKWRE